MKKDLAHSKSGQRKAAPTYEEYRENIAQPQLDGFIKMLNPEFVSRAGLTRDEIISNFRDKAFDRSAYENYIKKLSPRQITRIIESLPAKSADEVRRKVFKQWPLVGPLTKDGVSALKIILGWLGGDAKAAGLIRPKDKLLQGGPAPVLSGNFKRKLWTLLTRALDIIQCGHYDPTVVSGQNDRLNQFVNSYLCPDFVPFTAGGASHIDFVVVPETVTPADSKEVLDIKYKINAFFLGQAKAKDTRASMIEKDYPGPLNPDEYIGNPDKKAYFDMFLDIRVSVK